MFVKFRWRLLIYVAMFLYFHQDASKDIGLFSITEFL